MRIDLLLQEGGGASYRDIALVKNKMLQNNMNIKALEWRELNELKIQLCTTVCDDAMKC